MAHRKAEGSTNNGRDSNPKYLGVKINHGEKTRIGQVIVRQKGSVIMAGKNVGLGHDYTLFAKKEGTVSFSTKRKQNFDSSISRKPIVHVI